MKTTQTLLLATLLATSPFAFAHGDAAHDKKPAATTKEQKDWGIAGDAKPGLRKVEFKMTDNMRFTPDHVQVKQGETVRFVLRNNGQVLHEFVIGTKSALEEHAALMVKFPGMEHSEPYMAHVAPGKTGEVVWTFNRAGDFSFACLIAGHYQAGMVGTIKVAAK
ncbi:MAG TPA: cupredoxin family protein [Ideonella sp.]|nr:cupredoxin family protein [Ideonella sp.]